MTRIFFDYFIPVCSSWIKPLTSRSFSNSTSSEPSTRQASDACQKFRSWSRTWKHQLLIGSKTNPGSQVGSELMLYALHEILVEKIALEDIEASGFRDIKSGATLSAGSLTVNPGMAVLKNWVAMLSVLYWKYLINPEAKFFSSVVTNWG